MNKKNRTFKLHPNTIQQLKSLADSEKESQAKIIEYALDLYEQHVNDHKKRFMDIYHAIGEAEQQLEYTRDTDPTTGYYEPMTVEENFLSKDENEVYEFYGRMWNEMRRLPFFSEVEPTETENDF